MKKLIRGILQVTFAALLPHLLFAQSGTLGSASSPVVNSLGQPMGGVDVAICQPLATTAASVTGNLASLTMASNPITAGFAAGGTILVSGFSGADTYFNGGTFTNGTGITNGYTILSVTPSTVVFSLTHANATASSNGTVLQMGNSTTPCGGLSPVYSDPGLTQSVTQPLVTDGLGNWNAFVAQSGQTYYVQFYGAGLTTSMRWIVVSTVANAAVKPQTSDAVQYVSPNGNDSNDGLSMGTAKLTIYGAYNALPASGGTIYVTGTGAPCTPVSGQGLGIAGSSDTNYANIPEVIGNVQFVRAKSGPVHIQGLSATHFSVASNTDWATQLSCGNTTTPTVGLWLSSIPSGMTISRLNIVSKAIEVGVDSSGVRNVNVQANNITFDHDDFRSDCATCGPTIDFGVGLNDVFTYNAFENNAINLGVSASTNQASAVYLSNNGVGGVFGLNYFDYNTMIGGGGIRIDSNSNVSGSLYVSHAFLQAEGLACQPVLEVLNSGSYTITFDMQGGFSDCGPSPVFVRTPAGNDPCSLTVRGLNQNGQVPGLEGPMTVGESDCGSSTPSSAGIAQFDGGIPAAGVTPGAKNQRGSLFYGIQHPQVDQVRRAFGPGFVRFANIAPQTPSSWVNENGTGATLTQIQGPGDPSGVTNAATLNCTGNAGTTNGCDWKIFDSNVNFGPGDYIYFGIWAQPASTAGFTQAPFTVFDNPVGVFFVNNTPGLRLVASGGSVATGGNPSGTSGGSENVKPYYQTDGNWQWLWAVYKVTAPFGSAVETRFLTALQAGFPINVYAPMFVQIPAASLALVAAPTFSSASESGNNATFTTTAAHKLSVGMPIVISSCSISGYNGEFVITSTTSTTFTVFNSTTGLGSPTGCVITPSNDSEAADWANNVSSYGDNCTLGTFCGIRGVTVPKVIASGTSTLGNSAITSGACATVVTTAASGVLTTDRIEWAYASAPATADGLLTLSPYVTSGNVNWKLCNPTASSQTPSGLVVNWEVLR